MCVISVLLSKEQSRACNGA